MTAPCLELTDARVRLILGVRVQVQRNLMYQGSKIVPWWFWDFLERAIFFFSIFFAHTPLTTYRKLFLYYHSQLFRLMLVWFSIFQNSFYTTDEFTTWGVYDGGARYIFPYDLAAIYKEGGIFQIYFHWLKTWPVRFHDAFFCDLSIPLRIVPHEKIYVF